MESLAQLSTAILVAPPRPTDIFNRRRPSPPVLAEPTRRRAGFTGGSSRPRSLVVYASRRDSSVGAPKRTYSYVLEKLDTHGFASISSSSSSGTSGTICSQQVPMPPPSSSIGSPLFWIGVGVGLSALFSMVAKKLKERAAQQLFQSVMSQQAFQNDQFSTARFSPNSPFPFGAASSSSQTASSPTPITHRPSDASKPVTLEVPSTEVETTSSGEVRDEATTDSNKFSISQT